MKVVITWDNLLGLYWLDGNIRIIISLRVTEQGLDFMAHSLYIHIYTHTYIHTYNIKMHCFW
jgi:hypothetical protein